MQISELHISQEVRHPDFDGIGEVKEISTTRATVMFNIGNANFSPENIVELVPANPVSIFETISTLKQFITEAAELAAVKALSFAQKEVPLASKWTGGSLTIKPKDVTLMSKDVEINVLFHKIVMIRDNLRVLEQKINTHPNLNNLERVELQQYITRSYGSLTTFNILFKEKEDQF